MDDFGRQHCAPRDLLNRWMVPLENGVDYLTLRSGVKFEVPFHVFVAFATNLKPSELVDEAFLRRVQYKVFAENPNRPLNRDWLLEVTAHREMEAFDRAIDLRITRLRRKIEVDPSHPDAIRTVRGVGYMFVPPKD